MTDSQTSSPMRRSVTRIWVHGFVWGMVIVLIGVLIWFFWGNMSLISMSQLGKKSLPIKPPPEPSLPNVAKAVSLTPPGSAALNSQLAQVLSGIKEANQEKDLGKLLSYYSPNFPRLTNRAQSISKSWKVYNYAKMEFDIKEIKRLNDNTALAKVTWNVEAQYRNTGKCKNISNTYLIKFVNESGQWRIQALENAR